MHSSVTKKLSLNDKLLFPGKLQSYSGSTLIQQPLKLLG